MMEEGVEWQVICEKLKCSKQLIYKVRGPTYKSKVSGETVRRRSSRIKPSLMANKEEKDHKVDVHTKEEYVNGEEMARQFETDIVDDDHDHGDENEYSVKGKKCPMCEYVIEDEKTFTKHMISVHVD